MAVTCASASMAGLLDPVSRPTLFRSSRRRQHPREWGAPRRPRSVRRHGLVLLGETHGVAETPLVIEALIGALGIRTVALEWPRGLEAAVGDLGRLGTGPAVPGRPLTASERGRLPFAAAWSGDGRPLRGAAA